MVRNKPSYAPAAPGTHIWGDPGLVEERLQFPGSAVKLFSPLDGLSINPPLLQDFLTPSLRNILGATFPKAD